MSNANHSSVDREKKPAASQTHKTVPTDLLVVQRHHWEIQPWSYQPGYKGSCSSSQSSFTVLVQFIKRWCGERRRGAEVSHPLLFCEESSRERDRGCILYLYRYIWKHKQRSFVGGWGLKEFHTFVYPKKKSNYSNDQRLIYFSMHYER